MRITFLFSYSYTRLLSCCTSLASSLLPSKPQSYLVLRFPTSSILVLFACIPRRFRGQSLEEHRPLPRGHDGSLLGDLFQNRSKLGDPDQGPRGSGHMCPFPFPPGTGTNPRSVQGFAPTRSLHVTEIDGSWIWGRSLMASPPSVSGKVPSHVTRAAPNA